MFIELNSVRPSQNTIQMAFGKGQLEQTRCTWTWIIKISERELAHYHNAILNSVICEIKIYYRDSRVIQFVSITLIILHKLHVLG